MFEPSFGRALALGGDLLAVAGDGVDAVHLYRHRDGDWSAEARLRVEKPSSRYGGSVAVAPSGRVVAVGSLEGEVDVFRRGGEGRWTRDHRVHPPAWPKLHGRVWFGASVAMNNDFLVVGAPLVDSVDDNGTRIGEHDGAVFVFRFRTKMHAQGFASWDFVARIDPPAALRGRGIQFGRSVQIDSDNRISVGGLTGQQVTGAFLYDWVEAPFRDEMKVSLEWQLAGQITWDQEEGRWLERFHRVGDRILATVRDESHQGKLEIWMSGEGEWSLATRTAPPNGADLVGAPALVDGSVVVRGIDPTPVCATIRARPGDDVSHCPPGRPEVNGIYIFEPTGSRWRALEDNGKRDPRDRALVWSGKWLGAAGDSPRTVVLYPLPLRKGAVVIGPPEPRTTPVTAFETDIERADVDDAPR